MDREKAMLRQAMSDPNYSLLLKARLIASKSFRKNVKPAETSEAFRKKGNVLYGNKLHDYRTHLLIFDNYCRAILTAPNDSEQLALAYGNRSALLLHLAKYEDCIKDIDRAVMITKSNPLRVKLLCRKAECLKKLGSSGEDSVLQQADTYIKKMDSQNKKNYSNLIDKVKAMKVNVIDRSLNHERIVSETKDVTECIKIAHSQEFGRHLLAEKDYAPGDVIFIEKPYVTCINPRMISTNCDYCLKTAWSGIPCRHCDWTIFCSEECKDKAFQMYHDIECSLIPCLELTMKHMCNMIKLNLRAVIIAVKQAGSVSELMNQLKMVDKSTDVRSRGFYKNGIFESNTIESLYSLCNYYPEPDSAFVGQASAVLTVLIGICTQTKFMGNYRLTKFNDLSKNNQLMFLGSLMMKLIIIRNNTNDCIFGNYETCEEGLDLRQCYETSCCGRGFFMASLTSLINHNCFPNAGRCFTENQQIIIHAMHPIKKGEQITFAYYRTFYRDSLEDRERSFRVRNIFNCFCQPCKENWPTVLSMSQADLNKYELGVKTALEKKLYIEFSSIFTALKYVIGIEKKFAFFKIEDIEKLSKAIAEIFKHSKQPSYLTCLLIESLGQVFSYIYGLKPRFFGAQCH